MTGNELYEDLCKFRLASGSSLGRTGEEKTTWAEVAHVEARVSQGLAVAAENSSGRGWSSGHGAHGHGLEP